LEHLDSSLDALKEFTKLFTSEWAVRPFIKIYPKKTLSFLLRCAGDKNVNVRRWASEGSRPRLPWGEQIQAFIKDPRPTFAILEKLKFDSELFVRKSVSNHLNDVSKDHPDLVIDLLLSWKKQATEKNISKVEWIINKSLRTLIKNGHTDALELIGVSKAKIKVENFKIKKKIIHLGERLDFEIELHSVSNATQKLVIDYIIHFVKSNKTTAPKVFKLKTIQLPMKGILKIEKSHHLKKITTREYYKGIHMLEIQVNGVVVDQLKWTLQM
jgi:3-methyladenine DNA glycosylase AlkC